MMYTQIRQVKFLSRFFVAYRRGGGLTHVAFEDKRNIKWNLWGEVHIELFPIQQFGLYL
jgi:hypothetical protein